MDTARLEEVFLLGQNLGRAGLSQSNMHVRLALWWVSLSVAGSGLLWFLAGDAVGVRHGGSAEVLTGFGLLREGVAEAFEGIGHLLRYLETTHDSIPKPKVWAVIGSVAGGLALLALRDRPSDRGRRYLAAASVAVAVSALATVWGVLAHPAVRLEPAFFGWLAAVGLLCATPWLRRNNQLKALEMWARRPNPPVEPLPAALDELSPSLQGLVRETRRLRVVLDPLRGLDGEPLRLLWDWSRSVQDCPPDDAQLLQQLGLSTGPLNALTEGDRVSAIGAVLELDAALARFERALTEYRSFGFR